MVLWDGRQVELDQAALLANPRAAEAAAVVADRQIGRVGIGALVEDSSGHCLADVGVGDGIEGCGAGRVGYHSGLPIGLGYGGGAGNPTCGREGHQHCAQKHGD